MTAKEKEDYTKLEQKVKDLQSQIISGEQGMQNLKNQLATSEQDVKHLHEALYKSEQASKEAERRATEAEDKVETLTDQLEGANNDIMELNEELSNVASPEAQAAAEAEKGVLTTGDGRRFRLTVEAFHFNGRDYVRADVHSSSTVLAELVHVRAGILEELPLEAPAE